METSNKLREALEALNRIDTRGLKRLLFELVESDIFDGGQINKTISAVDKAKAALAAPLRNCDRFASAEEARKAHEEYRMDYIMRASNKFDFPMEFEAWLFAPATEGGDK